LKTAWKAKRQGAVWIVEDQDGRRGYFKFATKRQWFFSGPMIANEFIAAALARKLGFPVASLEIADVRGPDGKKSKGIVSKAKKAAEVIRWKDAAPEVKRHPEKYVNRTGLLSQLVVFDAWIANIDRSTGKNLILYREHSGEKYNWYLIDHGLALYGSPNKWRYYGKWNSPTWRRLWRHYHVPKGLLQLQSSAQRLEPMIAKIESLSRSEIDAAIRCAPKGFLREKERQFIRRLLRYRQRRLRKIIHRWLAFRGTKEYAG
jgi:hypothetical protein